MSRNGRIVAITAGDLVFFALGTGEYSELARKWWGGTRGLACCCKHFPLQQ